MVLRKVDPNSPVDRAKYTRVGNQLEISTCKASEASSWTRSQGWNNPRVSAAEALWWNVRLAASIHLCNAAHCGSAVPCTALATVKSTSRIAGIPVQLGHSPGHGGRRQRLHNRNRRGAPTAASPSCSGRYLPPCSLWYHSGFAREYPGSTLGTLRLTLSAGESCDATAYRTVP